MIDLSHLLHTSVEDCKQLLQHQDDLPALQDLHARCVEFGHKTRAALVEARIRKLERSHA